jgi:hypothetical protein
MGKHIWVFLPGTLDNVSRLTVRLSLPAALGPIPSTRKCQTPTGRRLGPPARSPHLLRGGRGRGRVTFRALGQAPVRARSLPAGQPRPPRPSRRRGRNSKAAVSLPDHLARGGDVWERGGLCNPPGKSDPGKKSWGPQHLRAAKAAHLPCQVYEGKERKPSENDKCHFGASSPEATRVIRPSRCFHVASLGRYPRQSGWHCG